MLTTIVYCFLYQIQNIIHFAFNISTWLYNFNKTNKYNYSKSVLYTTIISIKVADRSFIHLRLKYYMKAVFRLIDESKKVVSTVNPIDETEVRHLTNTSCPLKDNAHKRQLSFLNLYSV